MLTIIVGPLKEGIITADGRYMSVYPMLIEDDGGLHNMQARTDFAKVREVEMLLARWFLPFKTLTLRLTPEIKKAVVDFLHRYHAKEDLAFNCYSFVNLLYGIGEPHESRLWKQFWDVRHRQWPRKIGDVIFLVDHGEKRFLHAAVYIGFGLYLSVYGNGGDLEVATLRDMKRDYRARDVVLVTPRKP